MDDERGVSATHVQPERGDTSTQETSASTWLSDEPRQVADGDADDYVSRVNRRLMAGIGAMSAVVIGLGGYVLLAGHSSHGTPTSKTSRAGTTVDVRQRYSSIAGVVSRTSLTNARGRSNYELVREGQELNVYRDVNGYAEFVKQLPLKTQTVEGKQQPLTLVGLDDCTLPTIVVNASKATGSVLYGWSGKDYEAYPASGAPKIAPTAGDGKGQKIFGLNPTSNGKAIEMRLTDVGRGHGTIYDRCVVEHGQDVLQRKG